jgi:hypothetical protein
VSDSAELRHEGADFHQCPSKPAARFQDPLWGIWWGRSQRLIQISHISGGMLSQHFGSSDKEACVLILHRDLVISFSA